MQRRQTRLRIGFGLVAMAAVLALVAFMTMVSSNSGTTSVSATGPTPTTEPNPGTDGFLSGINDLEISLGPDVLYHCISRTDHDGDPTIDGFGTNRLKNATACYVDGEGTSDPANVLAGVNVPGEGPTAGAGPPPPPPYSIGVPMAGVGEYFPGGHVDCGNVGTGTCAITISCFVDLGAGSLGPNLLTKTVILNPDVTPDTDSGTTALIVGSSVKACSALDVSLNIPPSATAWPSPHGGLPIVANDPVGTSPHAWRTAAAAGAGSLTDFDGDGCSDLDELDTKGTRPKGCGDDPFSPLDSDPTVGSPDASGPYSILVTVLRAQASPGFGGIYFSCLADMTQTAVPSTGADGELTAKAFCYTDAFLTTRPVNSLGYPPVSGVPVTGDGFPGGGPPWAAIPIACVPTTPPAPPCVVDPNTDGEAADQCARGLAGATLDDDGDTVANDGCPAEGLADTDSKHSQLTGRIINNNLELRGCFREGTDAEPEVGSSAVGNAYVEMLVNKNTGQGTVDIWTEQSVANCVAGAAFGSYSGDGGSPGPDPVGAFNDAKIQVVRQETQDINGRDRDTDQDGCSDVSELGDVATDGGQRDPFNPWDWYDINKDGVVDLFGDILGVISSFSLDGSPPYDVNNDRGASISGGAGSWSREGPDGIIDLFGDILGVISQFTLDGCS